MGRIFVTMDLPEPRVRHEGGAAKSGNPDLLHEIMVETTATGPLIDHDGDWLSFDPASFLRRALEHVEAEGQA